MQTVSKSLSIQEFSQAEINKPTKEKPSDFWLTVRNNVRLQNQAPPIKAVPRNQNLPLSFNQERLWFLEQFQSHTSVHNILHCIRLQGLLNLAALEQSLDEIVRRHEILRTTFAIVDGQPIQIICPKIDFTLPVLDLRELPPEQRELQAQKLALEDAEQPFDLEKGMLWRFQLLRLAQEEYLLIRTIHHIIFDGWSHSVFLRELGVIYTAYSTGEPSPLPELPIQYADFAQTQRQWLQGEIFSSHLDYWKQQLSGNISPLKLPIDYPRPTSPSYQGGCQFLELSENLTAAIKKLSYQEGVSLFATLLAAFNTLLYQYTEQEDMLICSPVVGRHRIESKKLIGYLNNVVILRTDLSGNPSFRELLSRVSQVSLGATAYQDMPLQKVAELPNLVRTPLTRAMFVLQNTPNQSLELDGLTVTSLYVEREIANFDFSLSIQEKDGKLTTALQYKTDLFETNSITQMQLHFQTLLESLVANPDCCLKDLHHLAELTSGKQFDSNDNPTSITPNQKENFVAPQGDLEIQLTYIWEQVLGIHPIGVMDNFFLLGGYSLLAMRLCEEIGKALNINLPLGTIFQAPTIKQLVSILRQKEWSQTWSSLTAVQANGSKPPLFLCEGVGIYYPLIPYLGSEQPIYGLVTGGGLGEAFPYERLEDLAAHYIEEIRTIQPEGPYFLGGLSWGGIVALEMSQQLVSQGQEVALLAFFDTIRPGSSTPKTFRERALYHCNQTLKLGHVYIVGKVKPKLQKLQEQLKQYWFQKRFKQIDSNSSPQDKQSISPSRKHFAMRKAFIQACENYVPQVYPGRVTIFSANNREDAHTSNVPTELGWATLVSGGIELHNVPGDHLSILQEPLVQVLGEKLKDCLEKAQTCTVSC